MKNLFSLRDDLRDLKNGKPAYIVWANVANKLLAMRINERDIISPKLYKKIMK